MIVDVGNQTKAILVSVDNMDACIEFAKPEGERSCNFISHRFGMIEVITRMTSFKVRPGDWFMKRGPLVFKLTPKEFDDLYVGKDFG